MKRLLILMILAAASVVATSQTVIYNYPDRTDISLQDQLLGTNSQTLRTSNFKISTLGKKLFEQYGNDTIISLTKDYTWLGGIGDSLSTALGNLSLYGVNTNLNQTITGVKTFSSAVRFNGSTDMNSDVNISKTNNPRMGFFDVSGEELYLIVNPTAGTASIIPTFGTGGILLHQTNVTAGSNITITPTAGGVQISATGTVSTLEENVEITGTYGGLGVVPGETQKDYNTAAALEIGNNSSAISTNTSSISTLSTNKADKSNVLELDNTSSFTPTADYHPATKEYVDDNVYPATLPKVVWAAQISAAGSIVSQKGAAGFTASEVAPGAYWITHNFGDTNYWVSTYISESGTSGRITIDKFTNYIEIKTATDTSLDRPFDIIFTR